MAYISVPQLPPSMFMKNIGIIGPYCKIVLLKIYLVVNSYLLIVLSITNLWHIILFTYYELRVILYTNHVFSATI